MRDMSLRFSVPYEPFCNRLVHVNLGRRLRYAALVADGWLRRALELQSPIDQRVVHCIYDRADSVVLLRSRSICRKNNARLPS